MPVLRVQQGAALAQPAGQAVPAEPRRDRASASPRPRAPARPRSACRVGSTRTSTAITTWRSSARCAPRSPGIHIHGFTALEVTEGARRLGEPLETYLGGSTRRGSRTLPGTAAEILDDEVRAVLCPDKMTTASGSGPPHRPPGRSAVERDDHVRLGRVAPSTGRATSSRPETSSARRAGSPSSCRCRSCTWRRRSTSCTGHGAVRRSARSSSCTRSAGSSTTG